LKVCILDEVMFLCNTE